MALNHSGNTDFGGGHYGLNLIWSASQSISGNYSDITATLQISAYGGYSIVAVSYTHLGSKDPINVKQYKAKVREAQAELREHIAAHPGQLRRDYWKEKTHGVPALENLPVEGTIEKYKAGETGESPFERVGLDPQAAEKTVQEMENALDEFCLLYTSRCV